MTVSRTTRDERDWALSLDYEGDYRKPTPRTLSDAFKDADWRTGWQSAESAAANEEFIRSQFNGEREPDAWRWPHLLTYSIGAMFAALYLLGYFN